MPGGSPRKRARREGRPPPPIAGKELDPMGVPAALLIANGVKADVLFKHDGHVRYALAALGIETKGKPDDEVLAIAKATFNDDVREILYARLGDLEKYKKLLLQRQIEIALYGAPEEATRAFQGLSRVAGWVAPLKIQGTHEVLNIHTIMQDPELVEQALAALGHEPGAAVAISSEARERHASRRAKPAEALEGELVASHDPH